MVMKEKSTFLTILPYLLLAVVVLGFAGAMAWYFLRPTPAPAPTPDDVPAQSEPQQPQTGEAQAPIQTPDDASLTNATTYTYGALRLEMPGDLLLEENREKTRITVRNGTDTLPRLDGQRIQAKEPLEEEYVRLAAGLLQAYYADPPETDEIEVTAESGLPHAYSLRTAERGETPAMTARVRFLMTGNQLWYLILLSPEGQEPGDALTSVFTSAQMEG